jgi:hypothetical protein
MRPAPGDAEKLRNCVGRPARAGRPCPTLVERQSTHD